MKLTAGLVAGATAAVLAWNANAYELIGGITAPELAKVLQDKGYRADVGVDDEGDPRVKSAADGVNFTIFFYGCNHTPRCTSITFQAAFHVKGGLTTERINAWNRDKRFLKGWLDKVNDPFCEMDVDTEHGFTTQALSTYIDDWAAILPDFKRYIGF